MLKRFILGLSVFSLPASLILFSPTRADAVGVGVDPSAYMAGLHERF